MSNPDVEIITYGGGDLLWMVFNAISMLFYGGKDHDSFVRPLCIIAAMIGSAWGISKCFFQSYTDAFLTKYLIPLLAIPTLLIVPQARVHIIDKLHDKPFVIDHVPLLFAKIAGMSSYWGFKMTEGIEKVMHTPDDVRYCKTGMIFGSDTSLDFSRLKLNNATVAQNLHHFTQQCIIYDIALHRYSMDQLRNSSDLLDFLKKNTSRMRMIPYVDPDDKKTEFLTCIESLDRMEPLFDKEVHYYTKHEILKNLPITYQTLLNFKKQTESRIGSQLSESNYDDPGKCCKGMIVINAFNDATTRFAAERAKDNQRSIYQTAGALAGSSLVTMRVVLEALIYASCALILPLSLLPGGIKFISSWIFLNVWIQLWPPLYGILNYIAMIYAQKYAQSIMGNLSNGFSLFTSSGFQDMCFDAAALSGYLSLSVPMLSFYLLQNLQSLVHLSGSLMTPAHSAATTAATELSSGNYSYANTNVGQISYENQTAFQQNTAPTLSSGFFTDNHGTHQVKFGRDQLTVNQDLSNLNTSISVADAYSNSLQTAKQNALTQVESAQNLYTATRGTAERETADFIQHVSSSDMFSNGYSSSQILALQESANWVTNKAESWGQQHGLSGRESLEYFVGLGLEWPIFISGKSGHNGSVSVVSDEAHQSAENLFRSQDFQEHYQRVLNSTQNESINSMTDEGKRFAKNYATSMENLKSSQEQLSVSNSELNQISENLSYVQSHTSTVNTNLNTAFSNWLHERGELGVLFDKDRVQDLDSLRETFISEKYQVKPSKLEHFKEPNSPAKQMPNLVEDWASLKKQTQQSASQHGLSSDLITEKREKVVSEHGLTHETISHKFSLQNQELNSTHLKLKDSFDHENQKLGIERLNTRLGDNIKNFWKDVSTSWFDDYANPQ